jgi:hypothetical protein
MKKEVIRKLFKEIGSNFWHNTNDDLIQKEISLDYLRVNIRDIAFLSSGRGAISFVLQNIQLSEDNKVALLPPFTCHTVIEPFINAGYEVYYYEIDRELAYVESSLSHSIAKHRPSIILVHGYFGFNTLESMRTDLLKAKESGIIIIEDITQTLYSSFEHIKADYYICSLRKWTALPDGALAISTEAPFIFKPDKFDDRLQEAKVKAFYEKYLYMVEDKGDKEAFLRLFEDAEQILCEQESIFAMNRLSIAIQSNVDVNSLRDIRKNNFRILCDGVKGIDILQPIFRIIPEDVTPLYFPVFVNCDRKEFQSFLASHNIYAPVVWPRPIQCRTAISDEINFIYSKILAIPCDQRYGDEEMGYIIDMIKKFQHNRENQGGY